MASSKEIAFLSETITNFLIFIISIVAVLISILLFVLATPIYIFRYIIAKLSVFGPNLGSIVGTLSNVFAVDDIYTNPKCNVILCNVIQGDPPDMITYLRQTFLSRVLGVESGKCEKVRNEKMQQYIYQWMGFLFWKWDDTFDISHHINFYSEPDIDHESKISQEKLHEIERSLVEKPFQKNRSPWEIFVVRNIEYENQEGPHSALLIKIHHSIADGQSFMKIVFEAFVKNEQTSFDEFISKPNTTKNNRFHQFMNILKNVLAAPYQYTKYNLESLDVTRTVNIKNIPRNTFSCSSEKLSLLELKKIAKIHQVGLTSVIYAGFTSALRKAMLRKNVKVPKYVHIACPSPIPGGSDELTNHFSIVNLRLPVGDEIPADRLKNVQKSIDELKSSFIPLITFCILSLTGGLPPFFVKFMTENAGVTMVTGTSFPGSKNTVYVNGLPAIDAYAVMGSYITYHPVQYFSFSYRDSFRFTIRTDSHLIEDEDGIPKMITDMKKEFHTLLKCP